ncbi:four helix bundle protein [Fibrella sp. WM1]|uniref:four helix bundle protein n=1 Tax=Fibrella musci TaxID=3242485 RepID=UPI0035218128
MNAQKLFRFEDLTIWQLAIEVGDALFDIADQLEAKRLYRFAEQLRGAGMSISNNIAEGSGASSPNEFRQFLNYARRSCYECANILVVVQRRSQIDEDVKQRLFVELANLSRKIYNFQQTIRS